MDSRQLPAAWARSAGVYCTRTSFSASASVPAFTSGPDVGPVPKVGGAPGGGAAETPASGDAASAGRPAATAPTSPSAVWERNCLRELDMGLLLSGER